MEKAKTNWGVVIKISGVFVSWAIGSGFVTGAESMSYWCGYGIWAYPAILVAMLLHLFLIINLFKVGHERHFENPLEVFNYYCGEKLGKVFSVLALGLMFGALVVMISGFGATLNQYFHIPSAAGSAILAVLAFLTIVLGLRKLIDICGAIGPIIIVISIATGVIYLFQHIGGLSHGIAVAESLPINRIAPMWLISGLYYTTCTPMHSAPFFTATAATVSNKKDAIKGGILGVCLYCLVVTIMTSAIFTNIEYLSTKEVPNLEIANSISPILGLIFVVIIFLGIYSSAVPSMLSMCRSFQKEKTAKYNIFAAVLVGVSLFCATLLPFSQLMNLVYGAYGVIGGVFTIFVFIRVIKDRKAAA